MNNFLAQGEVQLGPIRGLGPLGLEGSASGSDAPSLFNQFISSAIGIMTIVAAMWFIFVFISGAISILTSGGDKAKVESARSKITYGIIGLAVTVAAIFTIELLGNFLGIETLLNPARFISTLYGGGLSTSGGL